MQKAANADLGPALTIEGNHLRAGLGTCRVAVVIQLREGRRGREGLLLPEPFDGFMIEPIARFIIDNPLQFPIMKAPVQAFEALQLLHGRFRQLTTAPPRAHFDMGGEEAKHPLPFKTSFELADGVGMEMRVGRPLCRGALVQ